MNLWHVPVYGGQDTYRFQSGNSDGHDVTDGQVLYLALSFATPILGDPTTSAPTVETLTVPKEYIGGRIRRVFVTTVVAGVTAAGNEDSTVAVLVNNTTATNVITTLEMNAVASASDSGEISVALPVGCFWTLRITAASFSTNPTDVHFVATVIVTRP